MKKYLLEFIIGVCVFIWVCISLYSMVSMRSDINTLEERQRQQEVLFDYVINLREKLAATGFAVPPLPKELEIAQ